MKKKTVIVVDSKSADAQNIRTVCAGLGRQRFAADETLVCFLFIDEGKEEIVRQLSRQVPAERIECVDVAGLMAAHAMEFRAAASSFVFEAYKKWNGLSCRPARLSGKRFSQLWWYTDFSEKNSLPDDEWWLWFHFFIVKKYLEGNKADAIIFSGNRLLERMFVQLSAHYKSAFRVLYLWEGDRFWWKFFKSCVLRGLIFSSLLLSALMSKIFAKMARPAPARTGSLDVYTLYPRVWIERNGRWQDMYYGRVIDTIREKGRHLRYVLRLSDWKSYLGLGRIISYFKMMHRDRNRFGDYVIFEGSVAIVKVFIIFLNLRFVAWFLNVKKCREFVGLFSCDGIDMSALFLNLFCRAVVVSWPTMEALEDAAARLVQKTQPRASLFYCFEYMNGRAITNGIRSVSKSTIIGWQHGPVTHMKLFYTGLAQEITPEDKRLCRLPVPDYVIVDGMLAKGIFEERGYKSDALAVCGPSRFDGLWPAQAFAPRKLQTGKIKVLLAPGLHDTEFVLRSAIKIARASDIFPRAEIVVKKHPKVAVQLIENVVGRIGKGEVSFRLSSAKSIYKEFEDTDIFMTTYSSTGVEALAFGLPVLILQSRWMPDISFFLNADVSRVMALGDSSDAKKIGCFYRASVEAPVAPVKEFFEYVFTSVDNRSGERACAAVEKILGSN